MSNGKFGFDLYFENPVCYFLGLDSKHSVCRGIVCRILVVYLDSVHRLCSLVGVLFVCSHYLAGDTIYRIRVLYPIYLTKTIVFIKRFYK